LSYSSSSFSSGYFGDRVLFFAQAGLGHNPPVLGSMLLMNNSYAHSYPALFG
jgi:hypothetical protein